MPTTPTERIQWIALTILGLVAGLVLALRLGAPLFAILGAMAGTPVVLSIVGAGLGTAQWPIIRRHITSSYLWIALSALGMAIGLTAGVILVEQIGRAISGGPVSFRLLGVAARAASFATIGLMGGGFLGFAQWLVLRRHAPRSTRWISVNAVSLAAGLASGSLLADAFVSKAGSLPSAAILLVIGSAVAGIFTARTLTQIFPPVSGEVSAQGR